MRLLCLLLSLLPAFICAEGLMEERVWTGKNGKTFLGIYVTTDADGKIVFNTSRDKLVHVDPANLSDEDLAFIEKHSKQDSTASVESPPTGDLTKFITDPAIDRSTIPIIDQGKYGNKASDCVPSSFCNFLLWWDQENYLPIDKKGSFDRKAEWIHTKVGRYFDTRNNSGTTGADAVKGISRYFLEDLEETANHRLIVVNDCAPENLARYTVGPVATMLEVSIFHGEDYETSHWVALTQANANGEIEFNTWGRKFDAKLVQIGGNTPQRPHKYDIVLSDPSQMTDWMQTNEVRFVIDPERYDYLTAVIPYRFSTPGGKTPVPPDPRFDFK
ncbi:MAG: hypothetical protein ACSHX9_13820 [Luteolibacter sp.]